MRTESANERPAQSGCASACADEGRPATDGAQGAWRAPALTHSVAERAGVAEPPAPDMQPGLHQRLQMDDGSKQVKRGHVAGAGQRPAATLGGRRLGTQRLGAGPCLGCCLPAEVAPGRVHQAEGEGGALAQGAAQGVRGGVAASRQVPLHCAWQCNLRHMFPLPTTPGKPGTLPLTCWVAHGCHKSPAAGRHWSGAADWPAGAAPANIGGRRGC